MNNDKLRALRRTLGFSQNDLARATGISSNYISQIERGLLNFSNSQEYVSRIQTYLENYTKKPEPVIHKPEFSFSTEHIYSISEKVNGKSTNDLININSGVGCVFKYVGKQGKHHCFVSVRGGWHRTYTDNQLVGKKIQEVNL